MKKYLFSALALTGMLFMNSCSDDLVPEPSTGDYVNATFTISTTEGLGTRAVGDGTTVDKVACAVFDENGVEMPNLRETLNISGKHAVYHVRLAKGQAYRVAFFAYNEAANAYDVTNMKDIKVNPGQLSNLEGRDAFTNNIDVSAQQTLNEIATSVNLYRPFAQLNLGIDDTEETNAANAGIVVDKTQVKVTGVYTAFSAYDNAVVGSTSDVTFAMNTIPTDVLTVEGQSYNYLAMNYLLVGDLNAEKSLTDVEFVWETADGKTNNPAYSFVNIPVQRNYRTNIVGSLLTNPADFTINIVEGFGCDKNKFYTDQNGVNVAVVTLDNLQNAIDAADEAGDYVIRLQDMVGPSPAPTRSAAYEITVVQKPGVKLTIDGCGINFNGQIKLHSNSYYYADAALTIKNVNFTPSAASLNVIEALDKGNGQRYSTNLTVQNCTFTATGEAVNTAAGVQIKQSKNAKVINCEATGLHSLVQANSCDETVEVKGCTVNDGKNGISFTQVKAITVEETTINASEYGIRYDGRVDNYGIAVKNINVTAKQPFIARKMTANNNTIAFTGKNVLTPTTANDYQVVLTEGSDDEAYSTPTGTYKLTGVDNFYVFPSNGTLAVATQNELDKALANSNISTIMLGKGTFEIELYRKYPARESLTIIGTEGTKVEFANQQVLMDWFKYFTIKNCEILHMSEKSWGMLVFGGGDEANGVYTVENCLFNGVGTQGIYINENTAGATYNVKNCTFKGDFGREGAVVIQNNANLNGEGVVYVNVEENTFNNVTAYKISLLNKDNGKLVLNTDVAGEEIGKFNR